MALQYVSPDKLERILTLDRDDDGHFVKLGEGGFGAVYRGTLNPSLVRNGGKVAVKLLHPRPEAEAELSREFIMFQDVKNPHLVEYLFAFKTHFDLGEGSQLCLALIMNFIEGGDLQTLVNEVYAGILAITPEIFWEIARQVVWALTDLHERGLAHRDIKPLNIMLENQDFAKGAGGDIKVVDLGLACFADTRLHPDDQVCRRGLAGTESYMSPELLREEFRNDGNSLDIFMAGDIWALGITLYELLEGHFPPRFGSLIRTRSHIVAAMSEIFTDDDFPKTSRTLEFQKAKAFVKFLLHPDWRQRPTAKEALYAAETQCTRPRCNNFVGLPIMMDLDDTQGE